MRITLIPLLLFLLTACTPAPTETPTPTPNGESTAIQANPTGTPAPSQTPAPTGIPPTISGASPGADGIGDPYFPDMGNGGYDVEKYTLEISVDPVSRSIDAVAALDILALHSLSSFNLDFDGPAIQSIHIDGEPAGYERRAGELIVTPHRPIAEGARFLVEITYAGDPSADASGGVTARESSWVWYPGGSFVAGEPTGAAGWYPVNEHPADKAVYEFLITVPAPYSVAANGELINTQVETGAATYHWIAEDPMAPYLVTVNVARFDLVEEITDSGVRIRNYFTTAVPESTRRQFDEQIEMLEFFEEIFGPYPFEMYGVVVHDLSLGFALETQTLSFFGSSFVNETVISHELAHQWFGDSVSLYRWEDIWLNEGFATYASLLWSEEKYGIFTLDREIERMYAAMAPGLPVYQTSRSGLVDGLGGLPYAGIEISRQQAGDALFALLENAVLRPEIDLVLEGYPENFDRSLILEVLDALPFTSASVTAAQVDSYLILLGLGDYSNGSLAYPPPGAPGPDRLFSGTVYQRGALTLHALRLAVGNTDFFEILKVYAERFANSNATTADFIAIAEEVSGEKLGELFDGWLYQVEIPDIPEMELFRADYLP